MYVQKKYILLSVVVLGRSLLLAVYCPLSAGALQGKSHLCIPFLGIGGLSPNSHIHMSVRDVYILRIAPHIWLQKNRQTDPGNI
jgi:hypothetical protein